MKLAWIALLLAAGGAHAQIVKLDCTKTDRCPAGKTCQCATKPVAKQEKPPAQVLTVCSPATDKNCPALTYSVWQQPPTPEWTHSVKNGVYTATFTDPENHWRCYVTGRMPEDYPTAFTVTCVDTTKTYIEPPAAPAGGRP
jgi:hypothetical protein